MEQYDACVRQAQHLIESQAALSRAGLPPSDDDYRTLTGIFELLGIGPRSDTESVSRHVAAVKTDEDWGMVRMMLHEALEDWDMERTRSKRREKLEKKLERQDKIQQELLGFTDGEPIELPAHHDAFVGPSLTDGDGSATSHPRGSSSELTEAADDSASSGPSSRRARRARQRAHSQADEHHVHFLEDETMRKQSQPRMPMLRPTFQKLREQDIELETLDFFGVPYCKHMVRQPAGYAVMVA
ncbi:hypothetical protein KEM52_006129 [Ascosphaera acerosa]|nr:hypothetical protein KEM52_006129 [Ascosphaera acerosa]